jgi:hypothetical protein
MTDDPVADAARELARWLIIAGTPEVRRVKADAGLAAVTLGLITEHDEQNTTRVRSQPRSAPPWNPAVANAVLDAHAAIRQAEADLHADVTGRPRAVPRAATERDTWKALDNIPALAAAASAPARDQALRKLTRATTAIRQLPAIDDAPVWQKLRPGPDGMPPICPYCQNYTLAVAVQSGMVMCRFPGCTDRDGNLPQARLAVGEYTGQRMVAWADGLVQVAP